MVISPAAVMLPVPNIQTPKWAEPPVPLMVRAPEVVTDVAPSRRTPSYELFDRLVPVSVINPVPATKPASPIRTAFQPPVALPSKVIVPEPEVDKEVPPAVPITRMPSPVAEATELPMPYIEMLPPAALMDEVDESDIPTKPVLPFAYPAMQLYKAAHPTVLSFVPPRMITVPPNVLIADVWL